MATVYHDPLPYQIRADLFLHLSTMERAGLPTMKSFSSLRLPGAYQVRVDNTRKLLARGAEPAAAGQRCGLFTPMEAALLKAAFAAGSPAPSYRRLADNYEIRVAQARQIRSRMAMPIMVLVLALFIQPLPLLILGTITTRAYLMQVFSVLGALGCLAYLAKSLPSWFQRAEPSPTRNMVMAAMVGMPLFGAMYVRRNVRDFFESLALLLEAGVPMFDALPIAVASIENSLVQTVFATILPRMEAGATLSQALDGLAYLDPTRIIAFAHTGETSGTLPEMLWRHVHAENQTLALFQQQMAEWLPRIFYGLVMTWMAYQMLTSGAGLPQMPEELR